MIFPVISNNLHCLHLGTCFIWAALLGKICAQYTLICIWSVGLSSFVSKCYHCITHIKCSFWGCAELNKYYPPPLILKLLCSYIRALFSNKAAMLLKLQNYAYVLLCSILAKILTLHISVLQVFNIFLQIRWPYLYFLWKLRDLSNWKRWNSVSGVSQTSSNARRVILIVLILSHLHSNIIYLQEESKWKKRTKASTF
jgi:hypothetical protein